MQNFLFFLDKLSALVLEAIIIIFSTIAMLLTFFGISHIPFYIDKIIFKNVFIGNIPLLSIILLITLIFILFRILGLINRRKRINTICYYLSIVLISISLFGFIANVIIDTFLVNNMYFYDKKSQRNKTPELTGKEWKDTLLVIIVLFVIYFCFIFLALSDNLRINLRISDSYVDYQLAIEEAVNNENTQNDENIKNKKNKEKVIIKINNINEKDENNNQANINNHNMIGSDSDLNKKFNKNVEKKI